MSFLIFTLRYLFLVSFLIMLGVCALAGFRDLLKPRWLVAINPELKKLSLSLIPLLILFVLVLIFQKSIFPFTLETLDLNTFRGIYYQNGFFIGRGILYLVLAAYVFLKLRRDQEVAGTLTLIGVLFFGSFACYDWVLSQSKDFHSTIFGLLLIINGVLIVHAIALFKTDVKEGDPILLDLNTVFLATIALWSYLALMQYITVWSGNLPIEVAYFKERFHGSMGLIASISLAGQALIPIPLLLFKRLKRKVSFTRSIASYTLIIQALQLYWLLGGIQ